MSHPNHAVAAAYLSAVTAGDLPDSLLTDDMTAWLTTQGPISKAAYHNPLIAQEKLFPLAASLRQ